MDEPAKNRLYDLLPTIYRVLDSQKQGRPMRALIEVIETEMQAIEEDISGLYDDWFIETCADWVIPYIGDLLGVEGVRPISTETWNLRSYVANTMAYRRRKGTAAVLEQTSQDVTGWPTHITELFQLVATTQHLNHLRPHNLQAPDLRNESCLESMGGPFDVIAHTVDVRSVKEGGKYNVQNLGLFVWRLQSYPLKKVNARMVKRGCYTFDPSGKDTPLFNRPRSEASITHQSEEADLPGPLQRRSLYRELDMRRKALICGYPPRGRYFDGEPVFSVALSPKYDPIPPEEIFVCDLSDWSVSPDEIEYEDYSGMKHKCPIKVAVDPMLGRLRLSDHLLSELEEVLVSYSYGFCGDVGAGPYDHSALIGGLFSRPVEWQVGVKGDYPAGEDNIFKTVGEALVEWNDQPAGTVGMIVIMDSRTYAENLKVEIKEGCQLFIVAADWSPKGGFRASGVRPHINGRVEIIGRGDANNSNLGELVVAGLLIEGEITVLEGNLGELQLARCTVVPDLGGICVLSRGDEDNRSLKLTLTQTICGRVSLSDKVPEVFVAESIVDHGTDDITALRAKGAVVRVEKSTIIGRSEISILEARDSIFTDVVTADGCDLGFARFCYLPAGSCTSQRFRCHPDPALPYPIQPVFTSMCWKNPAYSRLDVDCPDEIRTGAEGGSEMGSFCSLQQPQREANLCSVLEEYTPFGLEVCVFYVT